MKKKAAAGAQHSRSGDDTKLRADVSEMCLKTPTQLKNSLVMALFDWHLACTAAMASLQLAHRSIGLECLFVESIQKSA